jgi:hypothetical protein
MKTSPRFLQHTRPRRVVLWSAVAVLLVAVVGGVAVAQKPPPEGKVTLGNSTFSLSGKIVGHPLTIGQYSTLLVTVKNPTTSAIRVTALNARAVSVFNKNCKGAWIQVRRYAASATLGALVPAKGQRGVRMSIRLANIPGVNQDACKSLKLPMVLSGQGVTLP